MLVLPRLPTPPRTTRVAGTRSGGARRLEGRVKLDSQARNSGLQDVEERCHEVGCILGCRGNRRSDRRGAIAGAATDWDGRRGACARCRVSQRATTRRGEPRVCARAVARPAATAVGGRARDHQALRPPLVHNSRRVLSAPRFRRGAASQRAPDCLSLVLGRRHRLSRGQRPVRPRARVGAVLT